MYNADTVAKLNGTINTNIGNMPMLDYLEIAALQSGFDSLEDLLKQGYRAPAIPELTIEDYMQYKAEINAQVEETHDTDNGSDISDAR